MNWPRLTAVFLFGGSLGLGILAAAEPLKITVDFARQPAQKEWRALHGVNNGPLLAGGVGDVTAAQTALRLPWTRLHDSHWPNPDVVDMHAVFPRPEADPALAESYDFGRTDDYLAAVAQTGAKILYRLGESIEHDRVKRYVHPPRDPAKWAQACVGVVRHCNEGWAGGTKLGITHWEIWNEPENRPVMWTGTDAEFFALYQATAKALRAHDPAFRIGGPGIGNTGNLEEGKGFQPSEFLTAFLRFCQKEQLPLDFFSWHCYTDEPRELVARAKGIRAVLDSHGFAKTENWLDEWNYLPAKNWTPLMGKSAPEAREQAYKTVAGPEGAAFLVSSLIELQDAPLDMACFYRGDAGPWGLFSEQGVPNAAYDGMLAFSKLRETPHRAPVTGANAEGISAWAGVAEDRRSVAILLAKKAGFPFEVTLQFANLPWGGATRVEISMLVAPHPRAIVLGKDEPQPPQDWPLSLSNAEVVYLTLRSKEDLKNR